MISLSTYYEHLDISEGLSLLNYCLNFGSFLFPKIDDKHLIQGRGNALLCEELSDA